MAAMLILLGFVGLVAGGEFLVRGAVAAATRLRVAPAVIGVTLVGFGTSTPELVTSLQAALAGSPGIAIGNVVGSNIANVLLILGLAALVMPLAAGRREMLRDGGVMLAATALAVVLLGSGAVGRGAGAAMLAGLGLYVWWSLRSGAGSEPPAAGGVPAGRAALTFLAGLVLVLVGARLLVDGAVLAARTLGVTEAVIGLTIVAVGTSLPELVTSVIAARRAQPEIALGNVIGSNVFNILGILGVTAAVRPLTVPPGIAGGDVWVMAAAAVALVAAVLVRGRIGRVEGALLLAAYALWLAWRI